MSSGAMRGILWDVVVLLLLGNAVRVKSQNDWDPVIENVLEKIMNPHEPANLQTQALRTALIRRVKDALQREELENQLVEYKRSLSSLARWSNLPNKRNLEALARAGYIRTIPENDPDYKRSISSLAKNGQLPLNDNFEYNKRGIESLARNGELHHKRENQQNFYDDDDGDDDYDKRNIASLARGYNFPSYGKRFIYEFGSNIDKRNIAALAREGMKVNGKRNVAALLRQDSYVNGARYGRDSESQTQKPDGHYDEKRNIGSVKAQFKPKFKRNVDGGNRQKRDVQYYDDSYDSDASPMSAYQDYVEELEGIPQKYDKPEKRFLGSVAKSGWFRPTSNRFVSPNKRHIGALARLGWLPSFRAVRRFNRSGRSTESCDSRSSTTDGEIEDNSIPENPFELDPPRVLVPRATEKMLYPRIYMSPNSI